MNIEQKILYQIHCRYNFYISIKAHLSHLYTGYVNENNLISPKVVDLFLNFLHKINFPNPEKSQEYIYNQIEKNIDDPIKLNETLQRFKKKVKECKYSDYRDDKQWRQFMDEWDIKQQRPPFNWEKWDNQNNKSIFENNSSLDIDNA
jgi:hypothetical protein